MKTKLFLLIVLLFGLSLTVAAQDDEDFPYDILEAGDVEFEDVDLEIDENFRDDDSWECFSCDDGDDDFAGLVDGSVEIRRQGAGEEDPSNLWTQDTREFENSVIMVETEQLSDNDNNGYGLMCRADPAVNFDGYLFYISGDGFVRISKTVDGEPELLFDWTASDAVNQGEEENELIAVCVENYLGFYVNGELVAEVEDDSISEGVTGFAAITYEEDDEVYVEFDNLMVWEVEGEVGSGGRSNSSGGGDDVDIDDLQDDVEDALEEGDEAIDLEDILFVDSFDDEGDWFVTDEDDTTIEVDDGVYFIDQRDTGESGIFYNGFNTVEVEDVVMTVTVEQLSDSEVSGYGVMCRVDPDSTGDGYTFLVTVDGFYFAGYWEDGSFETLVEGDTNDVEEGEGEINQMTVVCVDEYFAFYVNGELLDEFEDDTFDEGYAGLAVVAFPDDDEMTAAFDNLVIWEADD